MAQSTWPGQRSRTNVQSETVSDDFWREVGRLAETASDFNTQIFTKQAQDQYSTAEIQIKASEAKLAEDIAAEQDESKFEAILKAHKADVNKFMPKNSLAAKGFKLLVADKTISWDKAYKKALNDRLSEKLEVKFDMAVKHAETTGDMEGVTKLGLSGVALYNWDESNVRTKLRETESKALYQKASNAALLDPELVLSKAGQKDGKYSIDLPGLEDLTATQAQNVRTIAEGQKNYLKRQEDAALSAFYEDVSQKAQDGMSIGEMRGLILNQPGLTTKERDKAMNVFASAYNTWDEGGTKENPWKTTQDYNALMEMQVKISQGKPVTQMDIINAQMADPTNGPLFSNSDRNNLFSQLPDNKDPSMKTPVAKQWIADVDDMFMDKSGLVEPEDREKWMNTRGAITEIIRVNHPDIGKTQKEITAYLKPEKKRKTKELLNRLLILGSPLGVAEEITGLGGLTSPVKMLFRGLPKTAPTHVDTLEEAQKLKQGTSFEYQGRVYTRK